MNIRKAPDCNDLLRAHGSDALRRAFDNAPRNTLGGNGRWPITGDWRAPANRHERRKAAKLGRGGGSILSTATTSAWAPGSAPPSIESRRSVESERVTTGPSTAGAS